MKTKKSLLFSALFIVSLSIMAHVAFWGATGHRTIGQIAQKYLTKKTTKAVEKLLNGHSLAFYSTYADDIKSDTIYNKYYNWHFVNFEFGQKYDPAKADKKGDLIQGIKICVETLKNPNASEKDKAFYLKLLIHFIGDLHQPLHVGRAEDKGGNDIKLKWFYQSSNLHRVWDSGMIDHYGMSYTELAKNADVLSPAQVKAIEKGTILDWAYESQKLAQTVYASAHTGDKLSYHYSYEYFDTVRLQLEKGGIRLAKVLNDIFD